MFAVCAEHVELALDIFVDEFEEAPDLIDIREWPVNEEGEPPEKCMRCDAVPRYGLRRMMREEL